MGEGQAPSVLNGGLTNEWVILAGVMTLAIGGFLEFKSFEMAGKVGYKPGDYGFDPLGLHALRASFGLDRVDVQLTREEKLASGKADMELCEIKNGRLAMLAITGYALQGVPPPSPSSSNSLLLPCFAPSPPCLFPQVRRTGVRVGLPGRAANPLLLRRPHHVIS